MFFFRVRMKINLSYPATGCQKLIEISDELKVQKQFIFSLSSQFAFLHFIQCRHRYLWPFQSLKVRPFYEKRMGQEVEADTLGDEFKVRTITIPPEWLKIFQFQVFSCWNFQGYVLRITGGNDKQGFPMKQVSNIAKKKKNSVPVSYCAVLKSSWYCLCTYCTS